MWVNPGISFATLSATLAELNTDGSRRAREKVSAAPSEVICAAGTIPYGRTHADADAGSIAGETNLPKTRAKSAPASTKAEIATDQNVLFVVSECVPLVKTGGLADVAGSLPLALRACGSAVKVLLPAYPGLIARLSGATDVMQIDTLFGGPARVVGGKVGALDVLMLDAPHLYDRPGSIYLGPDGEDWPDNDVRFGALSYVGARIAQGALGDGWQPDIVHCHDWQAGLVPSYIGDAPNRPATVISVHNIAFQGLFPASSVSRLGLPADGFTADGFEFWGHLGCLKAGLMQADAVSTVSETYARELTDPAFGMGLEGVIAARGADMRGIVNGIDLDVWNPATDPHILPFDRKRLKAREKNRTRLLEDSGLDDQGGIILGVVSRLTAQKGLDLLLEVLPRLLDAGGHLVMLGSGDADLQSAFLMAAERHPGQIAVTIGYDDALSHRIYAGSDVICVPSRFEPCGLTQLYALRYGAIPLVARTGGLADTVIDATPASLAVGVATGVQFNPGKAEALEAAIDRVCALFGDKRKWRKIQSNAMAQPVGWDQSAQIYRRLYDDILAVRTQ
jgi:starch synthase